ncbi:MAG: DUF4390 domain-containing protein [Pseudomonadota bacterium]
MKWLRLMALALPLFVAGATHASAFQVQTAVVTARDGIYELDARIIYPLNDDVRSALADGATVRLALQVVIEKQRRYWLDKQLADATLRRELTWNAVSQRYILKFLDRDEQDSFAALDEALIAAGVVNGWRIMVDRMLDPDTSYQASVRAGYRSTRLPDALRALAFWSDGWAHKTEWKSWILPR